MTSVSGFAMTVFSSALPIVLAALGGLFTESAGSLSVALEGAMLAGAFASVAAAASTGSVALAMLAALLAGSLVGILLGQVSTRLRADVFVAGLAVNLLVPALVALLSSAFFGTQGVVNLPVGIAGSALSFDALTALAIAGFGLLLWLAHDGSPLGLRLRAAGEKGEAAAAAGLDRDGLRRLAHLVAGGSAGLAGSWLALSVAAFVPGMSAGRGWIALVAIYLGGRRPLGIVLASLGFGLLLSLSNRAQSFALFPPELLPALPYLVTLAVYLFTLWRRSARARD
ncbi:MAG TPA: ABC transporter permease [Rectinemataceae bacterium]|nr:ABC transporter permease [Rectinemataceae bacterium]